MQTPPEVTFKGFEPSSHVRERVSEELSRLDQFHARITSCRVVVERITSRRRSGDLYGARIHVALPGGREVAVARGHGDNHAHEDVLVAIRDAFAATQRQIEDAARIQRGRVKRHEPPPEGRVARLLADMSGGFIAADDGREIYFHRNSVLGSGFESIRVGDRVRFHEELGEKGPQASTVTPTGSAHGA